MLNIAQCYLKRDKHGKGTTHTWCLQMLVYFKVVKIIFTLCITCDDDTCHQAASKHNNTRFVCFKHYYYMTWDGRRENRKA